MTHKIYEMPVANVYPNYVNKAEKKGRTKEEVDTIIRWLTGYTDKKIAEHLEAKTSFRTFFEQAPEPNPNRKKITGVICRVRVEDIEEPLMQEIRYLDKMIDELARGKALEKIFRNHK
ncbi:MAG: DUF2200 domain-containing protein [Staphylococcus rostri]|uniref:DUF2200 domain-containing protein n=1 Tax=Staphylococcus rostri TaxID=522262 RepID=UPI0026DF8B2F|nr:DUF2200 domain-containing protein [Staphylococcus rostri]MDO5376290.1 DUF2200 domain-containing protein [Staphylococcus rostri]